MHSKLFFKSNSIYLFFNSFIVLLYFYFSFFKIREKKRTLIKGLQVQNKQHKYKYIVKHSLFYTLDKISPICSSCTNDSMSQNSGFRIRGYKSTLSRFFFDASSCISHKYPSCVYLLLQNVL